MRSRLENDTTVENTTRVPRSLSFRKLSTRCIGVGSDKRFNDEGKRFDGRKIRNRIRGKDRSMSEIIIIRIRGLGDI